MIQMQRPLRWQRATAILQRSGSWPRVQRGTPELSSASTARVHLAFPFFIRCNFCHVARVLHCRGADCTATGLSMALLQ